jgi:hypothetical protein
MGASSSKSVSSTTINTSQAVNSLVKVVLNCSSMINGNQSFIISGNGNIISNVSQVQKLSFNSTCTQSAQNLADLQQSVASAVQQATTAQSQMISALAGDTSADSNTIIENDVKQNITQETITNIINNVIAAQEIIISGNNNVINGLTQTQTLDIVSKNCQNAINELKSVQAANNAVAQTTTAKIVDPISSVLSSLGGLFSGKKKEESGMSGFMFFIFIVIIAVGITIGYYLYKQGTFGDPETLKNMRPIIPMLPMQQIQQMPMQQMQQMPFQQTRPQANMANIANQTLPPPYNPQANMASTANMASMAS